MPHKKLTPIPLLLAATALSGAASLLCQAQGTEPPPADKAGPKEGKGEAQAKLPLAFTGGHDTDSEDRGRPVALIAAALGVTPELFREAFRGVTPAPDGKPSPELARRSKEALLRVLGPHGVSGERLDEVSDYYRHKPGRGQLWRTVTAAGYAVVEEGRVKQVVVTEPGAGYSTPPLATVQGLEGVRLKVTLHFGKDLRTNGSVATVKVAPPAGQPKAPPRLQAVPLPYEQVELQRDGAPLARYHYGPALKRPFLFPVLRP